MSAKKKIVILSLMVALLAVTAVFNFVLSGNSQKKTDEAVATANYFVQYRTERNESRSEQLLQLDKIIETGEANSEAVTTALNMKLKLTEITEKEMLLERLIKAKGYNDTVVSIGVTSENINVIVKDADFDQNDAVVIYSILSSEAAATSEEVNIIPIS